VTAILGLAVCTNFKLIGTIPGTEVVLIPVLPILLVLRFKKIMQGRLKYLFLLLGLWLAGQIATDVYRGTEFVDWARSDSAIVFFAMDLATLAALLSGNERRKAIFFFSFAVGSILATRISPNYFFEGSPWKFGYGPGITSLVVFSSSWFFARRQYPMVVLLFLGISGVNLFFNFRSPVLILFVTFGLIVPVIPERVGRLRILPASGTGLRLVVLFLITIAMGLTAKLVLTGLSASGALGEEAQQKNEAQGNSELGLLLGGRPEILMSVRAVFDSPILGHGSYARDIRYIEMYRDLLIETGTHQDYFDEKSEADVGIIPTHSEFMQAWVFAGVLGAIFWGYVFLLVLRGIIRCTIARPALSPIYCFLCLAFLWDILFSPFGSTQRVAQAFLLVVVCDLVTSTSVAATRPVTVLQRRQSFVRPLRSGA
jgi:O-antigen ligase